MDPSDATLMRRLNSGDTAAMAALMKRWSAPIRSFISHACGWLGSTDDIHQDVWTRVFVYRKRYRPEVPFRCYLFKVALNCCRTAMRKAYRVRPLMIPTDGDLAEIADSDDPPALDVVIRREQHRTLHRAIGRLPRMQREVVLLYLLFDTDYRRIAELLDRSPGTVRSNMHHAIRKLRITLDRVGSETARQETHERSE